MAMKQVVLSLLIATIASAQQPDNTERNKRDRDGTTMTAEKQGNSKADMDLLARIRRSITKDKTLSTTAHNVKIIVNEGHVWLRGPVPSEAERDRITALARQNTNGQNITSLLEVIKGEK